MIDRHRPSRRLALAVAFAAGLAGSAAAQDSLPRQACKADVAKFCADVPPGGGRIKACLEAHASALSDPCRAALAVAGNGRRS